jgi:hypothetical protein
MSAGNHIWGTVTNLLMRGAGLGGASGTGCYIYKRSALRYDASKVVV